MRQPRSTHSPRGSVARCRTDTAVAEMLSRPRSFDVRPTVHVAFTGCWRRHTLRFGDAVTAAAARDLSLVADQFLAAQLAGDRMTALRLVLDELERGCAAEDIHLYVVAASQREIGRLWQENRISIAEEHLATAISQLVLAHVFTRFERTARLGKRIVVACVEGELHDMAARIAGDLLDASGFDVDFLGANVPTKDLVERLVQHRPDALALSVTMTFHLSAVRKAIAQVRAQLGPTFPIILGGEAVVANPVLFQDDHVHPSRGTARSLVTLTRSVLGEPEAAPPARPRDPKGSNAPP